MKKRAKGQFERKYLPEGPYEKVSGAQEMAERLGLASPESPENLRVAEIIYEGTKVKPRMQPKHILAKVSTIDQVGQKIAEECKVTYSGAGMSISPFEDELRRVSMYFVPDEYSTCLRSKGKDKSRIQDVALYYSPKEKIFFA